ncbi:hypothetical protein NA57DRAFT_70650 [Rhizodiscina lignyota]|uniref:Major facilitator superfamily (MFS) profile domain-containing protein n=1 Tax=Rhizodiscina lignyota TaxID=1504668 RepID=A0A9P4IS87_9PEZI|nr:hypothetical protein NA57DRAFT_70650 [Rhizodiscina lignyota]
MTNDAKIINSGNVTFHLEEGELGKEEFVETEDLAVIDLENRDAYKGDGSDGNVELFNIRAALAILLYFVGGTLPYIEKDLGFEKGSGWVPVANTLATTVISPFVGYLQDLLGRRYIAMGGSLILIIGIIIVGTANSFGQLVAGMAIGGAGAGVGELTGFAGVSEIVPVRYRGYSIALMAFFVVPWNPYLLYSNLIAGYTTWRWTIWITLIVNGITLTGLSLTYFPKHYRRAEGMSRRRILANIDYVGGFLSIVGLTLFLVALQAGGYTHPWKSAYVLCTLIIGLLICIAFGVWEWKLAPYPMIPRELFSGQRVVGMGFAVACVGGINFFSLLNFYPLALETLYTSGPVGIGVKGLGYGFAVSFGSVFFTPVMKLFWSIVSKPPATIGLIQANLLLCTWPFPTSSLWTDLSTNLGGFGIISAMHLGLHQRGIPAGFSRNPNPNTNDAMLRERSRTWAGCNIVSQRLSAIIGLPLPSSFKWTVDVACQPDNPHGLPDDLYHQLIIHRLCDRLDEALSNKPLQPGHTVTISDHYDLLTSLEKDLHTFEQKYITRLSRVNRLYLLSARLHLQAYHFLESDKVDCRKDGILTAYRTASNLILEVDEEHSKSNVPSFLSNFLLRMLSTSAAVLYKVLLSDYAKEIDARAGRKSFNKAIACLRRCSVENNDIAGRTAEIMTQIWVTFSGESSGVPRLRVNGRLAASVAFDCLWQWHSEFGKFDYTPSTAPPKDLEANITPPYSEADFAVDNLDLFLATPWL